MDIRYLIAILCLSSSCIDVCVVTLVDDYSCLAMHHQNPVDNIHFMHANKMAETLMRLQQHQQDQDYAMSSPHIGDDRQSADVEGQHRYEQHQSPLVLNYASSAQQTQPTVSTTETSEVATDCGGSSQSLFVVIPRIEYDFMKQELAGLRHTLNELKNTIGFEIHQLKVDGKALKHRVDACLCSNNLHHRKDACNCQKPTSWNNESNAYFFYSWDLCVRLY